ncbi:MAG TPA: tripartite tricarboxylate transporter substrate binding protein, partial [Burkholderiales bacterium]|nr:tripartite tricarboxylate transporter substrate binding protein [Burkholderiales bacterium]
HPSVPAKNPKELIEYARSRPGQLSYLVPGTGSLTHLVTESFAQRSGIKMVYVPYKSTGLGMPDLLNGQTQVILGGLLPILPHIQQGRLRALGVTTAKRWYAVPEIPTLSETLPGFEAESWFGLVVPKRTPEVIVARLNQTVNQMLNEPETKKILDALGVASAGGAPAQLASAIHAEHARSLSVVKDANIRPE